MDINLPTLILCLTVFLIFPTLSSARNMKKPCSKFDAKDECPKYCSKKRVVNRNTCCQKTCDDISEARVLEDMRPRDGCFGDCIKCSSITDPYPHYKNLKLDMCIQCRDCNSEGKIEAVPCGDTNNAVCKDKTPSTPPGFRSTTPVLSTVAITTGMKPYDINSEVPMISGSKQEHGGNSMVYAIVFSSFGILVLLGIVIVAIYRKKISRSKRRKNGKGDETEQIKLENISNDQKLHVKETGKSTGTSCAYQIVSIGRDSDNSPSVSDDSNRKTNTCTIREGQTIISQDEANKTSAESEYGPESVHFFNKNNANNTPPHV